MKNPADITIIGSGILGLLMAKELRQAGATVTIVEKNATAQEASWAGGGILLPLYPWRQDTAISQLVIPSLKMYPLLNDELSEATGIDPEWTQSGLLITKNPDAKLAQQWCETYDIPVAPAESAFFENLHSQALNPLWLPTIAQVRNPRLLKALKAFLLQQGVEFIDNCTVTEIVQKNNQIQSIHTSIGNIEVKHLVIAAGAWTGELTQHLFPPALKKLQIAPVKGQMLLFQARQDTLFPIVLDDDHYLVPRRDGKILVGSSVEHAGFDKTTTEQTKNKLKAFAFELFPILKDFFLMNHWAGLRPGTEHGVPYIDNHPEIANLSINAGHFRNGLTMAPASAQLMADLILNRTPSVDPQPYKLTRPE